MDTTLTPPLLPNPPKEIMMANAPPSYKDIAIGKIQDPIKGLGSMVTLKNTEAEIDINQILLLEEDKQWLYAPWSHSIIIKPVKSNFNHQYLKRKLEDLWKPAEPLCVIDLGMEFFTIKSSKSENQSVVLHGGHWFIVGTFILVRKWELNFMPNV